VEVLLAALVVKAGRVATAAGKERPDAEEGPKEGKGDRKELEEERPNRSLRLSVLILSEGGLFQTCPGHVLTLSLLALVWGKVRR